MDPNTNLLYQTPVCCCCFGSPDNNNNPMKRRSPSSPATATLQDPSYGGAATEQHRASKKLFLEQQDLTLNGVSTISLPHRHLTIPAASVQNNTNAVAGGSSLSPLPHSVKGYVCDPCPSPARTFPGSSVWGSKGVVLTKEEASDSMRMKRMKDGLREMRKWWDEVMRDDEEEDYPEEAEGDDNRVLSKNECGEGKEEEEAVSLEWADKCLSICFKCPCSKGYKILLSGNNCYYKLV